MAERFLLDIASVEIPDHRGRAKIVPFIDFLGPPRGYANVPAPESMRTIRRVIVRRGWWTGMVVGSAMTLVTAAAFASLLLVPAITSSMKYFFASALLVLVPLAVVYEAIALPIFRRLYRRVFPEAVIAAGHCPHCLYDLRGTITREADGCTICPECAAAWRIYASPMQPADG